MAAVTGPGFVEPPPARPDRRRRWLVWAVGAWVLVLVGAIFWSARNDPATVPEQRDIGHALPELRRATGALVAAAQDERWVLRLGEPRLEDCSLNPAWTGRRAGRELTLYVPEGEARTALDGIVAGLPAEYRAGLTKTRGNTQLSLYADAGGFIAIESEAKSTDQVLTVRLDSGCRPPTGRVEAADPPAGAAPEILAGTLAALGAKDAGRAEGTGTSAGTGPSAETGSNPGTGSSAETGSNPGTGSSAGTGSGAATRVRAVACPAGGTAATFEADAGTADPDGAPRGMPDGTTPVWAEPGGWAYRIGSESVVVTAEGGRLVVSVTTGCRAG